MKQKKYITLLFSACTLLASCNDMNYVSNDPDAAPNAPSCYDVYDLYQEYSTLFKPANGWVGDPMPYYENGKFHVFYLHDARDGAPTFHPWYEATTTDFITYTDNGEMIPCGDEYAQDGALGTGCVYKHNNTYYGFYTGHNGRLDPTEKIMLATSSDLKNWIKIEDFELAAVDGYDRNEFRDPFVFFDETSGRHKMLISTRADYKGSWRAVIAQYSSTDLLNWELEEPFYDDESTFMVECPDIFTMGNYQYLIYSDINDRMVHYKYRDAGSANWITPERSILDGIAYYAGKTASDGTNRYLFGWCPTSEGHSDYDGFDWAGALVVHQLIQNSDGTLKVTIPSPLAQGLNSKSNLRREGGSNDSEKSNGYTLTASSTEAHTVFQREEGAYMISATINASNSTRFGFEFGACGNRREVYQVAFDLESKELKIDYVVTGGEPETRLSVPLPVPADKIFNVQIVIENAVCVVYVNNEVALTGRIYKMNRNPWGIFASNGEVSFTNIELSR